MIRGNEIAIDLGLELVACLYRGKPVSTKTIAAYCDAVREAFGLPTEPIRHQDIFYLEHRALRKLRKRSGARTLDQWAEKRFEPQ